MATSADEKINLFTFNIRMASSAISRPMDIVVKSIMSDDILILDRQNRLHVPVASIQNELNIDIGGRVNAAATAINFTNSTIDFNGASINNFAGNIDGNVVLTGNITGQLITAQHAFVGTLLGNTFGTINTGHIVTPTEGAVVWGNLIGDFSGVFEGNISVNNIFSISPSTTIDVWGNLVLAPGERIISNEGEVGILNVDVLAPIFPQTHIEVQGDLSMAPGTFLVGNAALEVLTVSTIESVVMGGEIVIDGVANFGNLPILPDQAANTVFGSPDGVSGQPVFRSLVSDDIPSLNLLSMNTSSGNIGQGTLSAGTVTIINTDITASDAIFLSRSSLGGSTGLGYLLVTITPGASFTITSYLSDASTVEVGDTSIVQYMIVRKS